MVARIRNRSPHTRPEMSRERGRVLDELLVLRSREGSRRAFGLLARRWQGRLWRHARRLTGQSDAAWDVSQEAWLSIAKDLSGLDDPARFGSWAYTIVTRRAADWLRRNGGEADTEVLEDGRQPDEPRTETSGKIEALRSALRRLPGGQRALLSLRYVDGYEVAAIAQILGVPEGTVKSRLHTARERLRGLIERNAT